MSPIEKALAHELKSLRSIDQLTEYGKGALSLAERLEAVLTPPAEEGGAVGSSYRSDLNSGRMPEWQAKLESACLLVEGVIDEVYECIGEDGQFDNAAQDGALNEKLRLAVRLIREEYPKPPTEGGRG